MRNLWEEETDEEKREIMTETEKRLMEVYGNDIAATLIPEGILYSVFFMWLVKAYDLGFNDCYDSEHEFEV